MQITASNLIDKGVPSLYITEQYPASLIATVSDPYVQAKFTILLIAQRNLIIQVLLSKPLSVSAYVLPMTTFFRRIPK